MRALGWLLVVLVLAIGALWTLGGREPVFAIGADVPMWFVAVKDAPGHTTREVLADGVSVRWSAEAVAPLIGATDVYWDRFLVLAGGARGRMPLALPSEVADAYVAELKMRVPPRVVLGLLRALHLVGLRSMPTGPVVTDPSTVGTRLDVLPSREQIARLLAEPDHFAPAMLNFLRYHPKAQYAAASDSAGDASGAAAYARYGRAALQAIYQTGGHFVFFGAVENVVRPSQAGPTVGSWDEIAVMRYSSPKAILTMEQIPSYVAALKHRDAGLERTVILVTRPRSAPPP